MRSDSGNHAQSRENVEPEESIRPIPLAAAVITLAMVLFGVIYLLLYEPLDNSQWGDQRTLADLAGSKPVAHGQDTGMAPRVDGKALFTAHCATCHQATGQGLPDVFPPLDGSPWVRGEARVLANILLHGIRGEIHVKGKQFQGEMPNFQQLSDAELAGIASYIRGSWSNKAAAVQADLFAQERKAARGSTPLAGEAALEALKDTVSGSGQGDATSVKPVPAQAAPMPPKVSGKTLFATHCVACHQATGQGLPGVFPPLDGSPWVRGEPFVLANILLHGIRGEISVKGGSFQGEMPSFQHLSDAELAGIASYIRGSWSNKAADVQADLFAQARQASRRDTPFAGEAELRALRKP